ncbi:UNVERIFIED_CONTAM: hypothetical protein K2H54_055055 [Gekko kuhli]
MVQCYRGLLECFEINLAVKRTLIVQSVKRNVYDLTSIPVRHQLWEGWPASVIDDSGSDLEEELDQASKADSENTSMPSPDEAFRDSPAPSPTEDLKLYSEQLVLMAKALELEYHSVEPQSTDPKLKILYNPDSGPI